jgi:hypothetical protein
MADDQSGFDVWKYAQEGAQARQTQAATQIAQEQAQRERQKYAQEQTDKLHAQIGDALRVADDSTHYNQIIGALKQFGLPVSEYELAPDGSDFEAKRTVALARLGEVGKERAQRMDLATKSASLYGEPVKGTMTPSGAAPGAPGTPPVAPATPPFGTPPLGPSSPGMTTPTMNLGTGQMEAMPQSGTPPVMPPPGAGMAPMQGTQNPLIQAATAAGQSAPPPPPVSRETAPSAPPPSPQQGQIYVPKMPGMPIRFQPYPAGFNPTESDSDSAEIKNERAYQQSIYDEYKDAGLREKPSLSATKQIIADRNRGIIYGVKDGKLQPTGDFVPGSQADIADRTTDIRERKLEQPGGGNKPPAKVGEINEFRKSILEDPRFSEDAKKNFTYADAARIYDANLRGEGIVENNKTITTSGTAVQGGKQYAEEAKNKIAQQRADTAEALKDLKDPEQIAERIKKDFPEAKNINSTTAPGIQAMIKKGGVLDTDDDGNLVVTGGYKGSQIDNFDRRMKLANEKLDLDKNKFDFKKEISNKNYDLSAQKLAWTKEKDSVEHQAAVAKVKTMTSADAKMVPRIAAGFTLMGHVRQLWDTVESDPKATDAAIGWLNSHKTWQDVRNELSYMVSNKDQYMADNPRSAQYIKVAMGLASLDAEIDRAYFQGQGNLAEEARKRLDAMVLGLKSAPNAAVLKNGIQCLKGYVNEIIDTALPSSIMKDPTLAAERSKSLDSLEKFRHETGVDMHQGGASQQALSQPVFRSDDADLKKHINEQVSSGALKKGDTIYIMDSNGVKHKATWQ